MGLGSMVRPERFELPTYSSGGCRSIQLSYGRTLTVSVYMRSFALSIGLDRHWPQVFPE